MQALFSPRSRAERLIAASRVVLAASSMVAVWRDPSEPAKYAPIAYALLTGYLAYALLIAALTYRRPLLGARSALITHVFDLVYFSAFIYFTSGPASPFIAYFVFSLVCATLRWRWRGTLWTAIASLSAFLGLGYLFAEVFEDPSFELNDFLIRAFYMGVVALLLGRLGRHEERAREEISLLAAWPATAARLQETLDLSLRQAGRLLRAGRLVLLWRPVADGSGGSALLDRGELRLGALDHVQFEEGAMAEASFLAADDGRETLLHDRDGLRRQRGDPLGPELRSLFGPEPILSASWRGELAAGRLFAAGAADTTTDDLVLTEVVTALVGARLDAQLALERRRETAATEERVRLARDLHDGFLQSLTGVGLRVAAARRLLEETPAEAERSLAELQRVLAVEQRDLRFYIQDLEPPPGAQQEFDLAPRLAELVHRVEQEWQLSVELHSDLPDEALGEAAERDLYFLIREALVNAVRHGGASRVRVRIARCGDGGVRLTVEDDGHGFPFRGRREQSELVASGSGPRSLRERVTARGGRIAVESDESGSRVEMELPA